MSYKRTFSFTLGVQRTTIGNGGGGGLSFFSDMPVQIIERELRSGNYWLRTLMTDGNSVVLMQNSSTDMNTAYNMSNQWKYHTVLTPGPATYDDGYVGAGGNIWVNQNGTYNLYVYYHGEHQNPALPKLPGDVNGFYSSICVAISTDGGYTFAKLGQILTSAPVNFSATAPGHQGDGECSVTVDSTKQYLLCYYNDHYGEQLGRGVQVCVARTPISSNGMPGSWMKYYNGSFQTAGLGGYVVTPVLSSDYGGDAIFPHVQWAPALNEYVMIYCENVGSEFRSPGYAVNSGIYIAYSEDGIDWTRRQKLVTQFAIPYAGEMIAIHPSLDITSQNTNSVSGELYYAFSEDWPNPPHYLCGRSITISAGV
jgi:hypothetical protein